MEKVDILTCTDSTFVVPLGVLLHSICANNVNCVFQFHIIIDKTVSDKQKLQLSQTVERCGQTIFYDVNADKLDVKLPIVSYRFPVSIYYRLLMAKILPESVSRILYLDADIVVRHDLEELWKTDLQGCALGAVVNQTKARRYWERLDYPRSIGYVNSGVLLVDLTYWRQHKVTEQFLDYISKDSKRLVYPDQDVINVVLKGKIFFLKEKYNTQEGFFVEGRETQSHETQDGVNEAIHDSCVLHYTGCKPWDWFCDHPLKDVYYQFKRDTLWENNLFMETKWLRSFSLFYNELKRVLRKYREPKKIYKKL